MMVLALHVSIVSLVSSRSSESETDSSSPNGCINGISFYAVACTQPSNVESIFTYANSTTLKQQQLISLDSSSLTLTLTRLASMMLAEKLVQINKLCTSVCKLKVNEQQTLTKLTSQ